MRSAEIPQLLELAEYAGQYTDRVMIVGRTVEYGGAVPTMLARRQVWGAQEGILSRSVVGEIAPVNRQLASGAAALANVAYRSPFDLVCPAGACSETIDGVPMQFDYGHFTLPGATFVAAGLLDGWLP